MLFPAHRKTEIIDTTHKKHKGHVFLCQEFEDFYCEEV